MATSGSYSFIKEHKDGERHPHDGGPSRSHFYVHHDNYPQGAAEKLHNMVAATTVPDEGSSLDTIEDRRGGLTFGFIRGNTRAEYMDDHRDKTDAEWHYDILQVPGELPRVDAYQRRLREDGWRLVEQTDLAAFVRKYAQECSPIVAVNRNASEYGKPRYTLATAENAAQIARRYAERSLQFATDNPNRKGCRDAAEVWLQAVREQAPESLLEGMDEELDQATTEELVDQAARIARHYETRAEGGPEEDEDPYALAP